MKDAAPPLKAQREQALAFDRGLTLIISAWSVIDLLTLGESRQMVAVAEKIRTALLTAGDIYLLSTFRLPPKQGGVLFGLYSRQDNTRWLEASVVGKINKGDWRGISLPAMVTPSSTQTPPNFLWAPLGTMDPSGCAQAPGAPGKGYLVP